jgi:hypothetical protein
VILQLILHIKSPLLVLNVIFMKMRFIQHHIQESKDRTSSVCNEQSGKVYCSRVHIYCIPKAFVEKLITLHVRNEFYVNFSCPSCRQTFHMKVQILCQVLNGCVMCRSNLIMFSLPFI